MKPTPLRGCCRPRHRRVSLASIAHDVLRRGLVASGVIALGLLSGCGAADEQPHMETKARQSPIPVCTSQLDPVRSEGGGKAVVRDLDGEQWAAVMIPSFNAEKGFSATDTDCKGYHAFVNESLRGGISQKGWPRKLDPDEVEKRAGPDGLRVVWLRVLKFENGDEGGPIALVRAVDDRAEVYGIGSYRGPGKSQLNSVRLGKEQLVVSESKVCPSADDCRTQAHFFLSKAGRLIEAATVDLERVAVLPSVTARGLYARYTLRTDVAYKDNCIQLLEQVKVRIIHYDDPNRDSDRDLRKVEFSRSLCMERDALFPSNDPLWERVVGQD